MLTTLPGYQDRGVVLSRLPAHAHARSMFPESTPKRLPADLQSTSLRYYICLVVGPYPQLYWLISDLMYSQHTK